MTLLRAAFESTVDCLYIADGHHRTAAACRLLEGGTSGDSAKRSPTSRGRVAPVLSARKKYISALMFPHNQLTVLPYNRCVKSLNGMSADSFLEEVASRFLVSPCCGREESDSLTSSDSQSRDSGSESSVDEEEGMEMRMYLDGR
jgi:uncharacterized protein (DUF1015 family)